MLKILKYSIFLFLLTSCANSADKAKEKIVQDLYSKISDNEKREISEPKGTLEEIELTQENIGNYTVSEKYLNKKIYKVTFKSNNQILGNIVKLYDQDKIIGEKLRD